MSQYGKTMTLSLSGPLQIHILSAVHDKVMDLKQENTDGPID